MGQLLHCPTRNVTTAPPPLTKEALDMHLRSMSRGIPSKEKSPTPQGGLELLNAYLTKSKGDDGESSDGSMVTALTMGMMQQEQLRVKSAAESKARSHVGVREIPRTPLPVISQTLEHRPNADDDVSSTGSTDSITTALCQHAALSKALDDKAVVSKAEVPQGRAWIPREITLRRLGAASGVGGTVKREDIKKVLKDMQAELKNNPLKAPPIVTAPYLVARLAPGARLNAMKFVSAPTCSATSGLSRGHLDARFESEAIRG